MNKHGLAVAKLALGAIIMLLMSLAVYFIGGQLAKGIIAEAGTRTDTTLVEWKYFYQWLVIYVGSGATVILLLWTILSHWVLGSLGSKRWIWLFLGLILAAYCVVVPIIYSNQYPMLIIDMSIPILFFVFYFVIGYWLGSIFTTSDKHKYTPLLAGYFHIISF